MEAKSERKSQWMAILVISLLSAGTMYGAARLLEYKQRNTNISESIAFIEQDKLFGTIFRFYPEARERVRAELDTIYRSNRDVRNRAEAFTRGLARDYLEKSLPLASDQSIADLVGWKAMLIGRLQNDPVACVEFYSGRRRPDASTPDERDRAARRESELKAAIILSAKEAPNPAVPFAGADEAKTALSERYTRGQQDISSAARLGSLGEIPPEEGCRSARAFLAALASGEPAETARLFKHIWKAAPSAP